jgi:hypothetical protein
MSWRAALDAWSRELAGSAGWLPVSRTGGWSRELADTCRARWAAGQQDGRLVM